MIQAPQAKRVLDAPTMLYETADRGMNRRIRDWRGARVWIIGASTGIGAETANLLLEKGAHVAISARKADTLQQIADKHPHALVLPLDVTDHGQVMAARDQLLAQWGGLDLMLIVAGAYNEMRVDTFDMGVVNQLLDVNLRGVFHCIDAMLPILLEQKSGGGGIGIVSSVAGYSGLPKALVYGPTKAALINLAESLYGDLQPRGIGVSLVNPGFVQTPLTAQNSFHMPALITPEQAAREMLAGWQRGRFEIHYPRRFTYFMKLLQSLPYALYLPLLRRMVKEQG